MVVGQGASSHILGAPSCPDPSTARVTAENWV